MYTHGHRGGRRRVRPFVPVTPVPDRRGIPRRVRCRSRRVCKVGPVHAVMHGEDVVRRRSADAGTCGFPWPAVTVAAPHLVAHGQRYFGLCQCVAVHVFRGHGHHGQWVEFAVLVRGDGKPAFKAVGVVLEFESTGHVHAVKTRLNCVGDFHVFGDDFRGVVAQDELCPDGVARRQQGPLVGLGVKRMPDRTML